MYSSVKVEKKIQLKKLGKHTKREKSLNHTQKNKKGDETLS